MNLNEGALADRLKANLADKKKKWDKQGGDHKKWVKDADETVKQHKKELEKIDEVAPPGWGHTKAEKEKTKPDKPKSKIGGSSAAFDRARKEGRFKGSKEDMFKLMWWMYNKGGKPKGDPHYIPGTKKKYKKYQDKDNGVSEQMENVPPRDKEKIKGRFKTLHKKDLKGTLPEGKKKPLKGDPIELG